MLSLPVELASDFIVVFLIEKMSGFFVVTLSLKWYIHCTMGRKISVEGAGRGRQVNFQIHLANRQFAFRILLRPFQLTHIPNLSLFFNVYGPNPQHFFKYFPVIYIGLALFKYYWPKSIQLGGQPHVLCTFTSISFYSEILQHYTVACYL